MTYCEGWFQTFVSHKKPNDLVLRMSAIIEVLPWSVRPVTTETPWFLLRIRRDALKDLPSMVLWRLVICVHPSKPPFVRNSQGSFCRHFYWWLCISAPNSTVVGALRTIWRLKRPEKFDSIRKVRIDIIFGLRDAPRESLFIAVFISWLSSCYSLLRPIYMMRPWSWLAKNCVLLVYICERRCPEIYGKCWKYYGCPLVDSNLL